MSAVSIGGLPSILFYRVMHLFTYDSFWFHPISAVVFFCYFVIRFVLARCNVPFGLVFHVLPSDILTCSCHLGQIAMD